MDKTQTDEEKMLKKKGSKKKKSMIKHMKWVKMPVKTKQENV